jgi:hypothetical protein
MTAPVLAGGDRTVTFSTAKVGAPGFAACKAKGPYIKFAPDGAFGSVEECANCAVRNPQLFASPRNNFDLHFVFCGHRICKQCNPSESPVATMCELCRRIFKQELADTMTKYFRSKENKVVTVEQVSSKAKVDDDLEGDAGDDDDSTVSDKFEDLPAAEYVAQQIVNKEVEALKQRLLTVLEAAHVHVAAADSVDCVDG